jgi:methionine aminopeptidase
MVFPGDVCISVNDEVVHGIPGDRAIQSGDLIKLDLTAEKDGFHTDSAISIDDGWTVRTTDGSLSAHYEHTIVIARGNPVLLTAV